MYTLETYGVMISNLELGDRFKTGEVPASLVAVQVVYDYSGGFVEMCDHDTPLPLSLDNAKRFDYELFADSTLRDDRGAEVKHLILPFSVGRIALYAVRAWIGSQASAQDLATLDEIVGSVRYQAPPPPSHWIINGCEIERR